MVLLEDVLAENEKQIRDEIEMRILQQKKRNKGYIDATRAPLTPPLEDTTTSTFRTATTEYLPTPPASISSETSGELVTHTESSIQTKENDVTFRYASPSNDGPYGSQPSFRRRVGRGGRLMIDRRNMRVQPKDDLDDRIIDRLKFDTEEDEDEDMSTYLVDHYGISSMHFRAKMSGDLLPS